MDTDYVEECKARLQVFSDEFLERTRELHPEDSLRELACAFAELAAEDRHLYEEGPELVSRLFTTYPDFAPTFPRELLWFFGGECLHYMPDEEIAAFERRFIDGEEEDWEEE